MSQSGSLGSQGGVLPPNVPTSFVTDSGTAIPNGNVLNVNGHVISAGTIPFQTTGTSNDLGIDIQISQAVASTNATAIGLAAFDSSSFAVDANGFVTLIGGSSPFSRFLVDTGTSPVTPTGGSITLTGTLVAAGTHPIRTDGTATSTVTIEVQTAQAIASSNATEVGLAAFNSASFSVDANGFVTLSSTGPATTITGNTGGALPTTGNNWNILGDGSITTSGAGSTLTIELTGLTNHNVLVGAGTTTITKVAPSAAVGIPLVSQGSSADPIFGTATVPGGGTGNTTLTAHAVLIGEGNSPIGFAGPNSVSGIPLIAQGLSSDPIFGTAVVAGGGTGLTTITLDGVMYGNNTSPVGVTAAGTNGQVLIAATGAAPAFGTITSTDGSITFSTGANTLNMTVTGGSTTLVQLTANSGTAIPTSGNINVLGTGSITTVASGSTLTVELQNLTNHNVLVGGGTPTITNVAPSATSGVPLISQGSSTDPVFGTAVVAGGGTGTTSFTPYSVITGGTTSTGPLQNVVGVGTSGQVLTSSGASSLPTWQNAPGSSTPNAVINISDDFILTGTFTSGSTFINSQLTWISRSWTSITSTSSSNPGILQSSSITSAAVAGLGTTTPAIILGAGAISVNWVIKLGILSNVTNRYIFTCGLSDSNTASPSNNGVFFRYSDNLNSGNWQGITQSATVISTANSAIAAINSAYVNLGITINAAATSIAFFINGNQIANSPLTSNIPTVALTPFVLLANSSGTNASGSVLLDLFYMTETLTTPR